MSDGQTNGESRPVRARDGRFLPGNPGGPGARRGTRKLDFVAIVRRHARAQGIDLRAAVGEVFDTLLGQARAGDVQAARLLLDRLCGPVEKGEPSAVAVAAVSQQATEGPRYQTFEGESDETYLARLTRIVDEIRERRLLTATESPTDRRSPRR